MAKKNGIGATSGKKSSQFKAIAPDGSVLLKKSFFVHDDNALMGAFKHEGKWIASGVTTERRDWGSQIFLQAQKIK